MTEPIDALETETAHAQAFLAGLSPDDWQRPTRCPPMNVRELTVHAMRGAYRIVELLADPVRDAEPEKDAVTYFRYDPLTVGAGVVARAQDESAARPADADIAAEWATAWKDAIETARATIADLQPGDNIVVDGTPVENGTMTANTILSTSLPKFGN